MTHTTLIIGGPGCGKTHAGIGVVRRALESGAAPARVAFVAFTRAAARVARDRAGADLGLTAEQLPHFRTIHSACFRALGLSRRQVLSPAEVMELEELVGEDVGASSTLMTLDSKSRSSSRPIEDLWMETDDTRSAWVARRFQQIYSRYRSDAGMVDFTDMLEDYCRHGAPLDVDVAVVDEAQDLSGLQWRVVNRMFSTARHLYVSGDDDQAIHEWAGAARERFLSLGPDRTEVLPTSIRLPQPVFDLSQVIASQITERYPKDVRSSGKEGTVEWVSSPDQVDLSQGTWLMLARTRHIAGELRRVADEQGVPHSFDGKPSIDPNLVKVIRDYERWRKGDELEAVDATAVLAAMMADRRLEEDSPPVTASDLNVGVTAIWHDALVGISLEEREHLLSYLRAGSSITKEPRVSIGTIHGSKGMEADNVLLITDVTPKVRRAMDRDPDAEHRVWYVGATRASSHLYLCRPRRYHHYPLEGMT